VTFFTPGNQTTTGTDTSAGKTGTSDPVVVLAGTQSTLLNVVHNSPSLSTAILGQATTLMTYQLSIQSGTDSVDLTSLTVHAKDRSGTDIGINTVFQTLELLSASATQTFNVSSVSTATYTLGSFTPSPGAFTISSSSTLAVTLIGVISSTATAKNVQVFIDSNTSMTATDDTTSSALGIVANGDPTGFPMPSSVLVLSSGDLASSYGNYPNPFHPGSGNTTIEFNLQSPSSVSLVLYDVIGNKVTTLIDNQNLPAGLQRLTWDGKNGGNAFVLNGIYFAQLNVNGTKLLLKIAVVR
jgi:hypothetical protein